MSRRRSGAGNAFRRYESLRDASGAAFVVGAMAVFAAGFIGFAAIPIMLGGDALIVMGLWLKRKADEAKRNL